MGALIVYLELLVRLEKLQEKLTPQEVYLMQARSNRHSRNSLGGFCIGSLAAWLATKRLPQMPRTAVTAGAGAVSGFLLYMKSLESTVEYLVSLQGTRVQGELAHIMLKKHQNNPWVQQHIYKYFYPEVVYNDSSVDRPVYRWRYRNFFGDPTPPQSTPDSEDMDSKENDVKMTTTETKQAYVNAGECDDAVESPFDLVLGDPESAEDDPQANNATRSLPRRQSRREKRLRRRRRQHQQEEPEI